LKTQATTKQRDPEDIGFQEGIPGHTLISCEVTTTIQYGRTNEVAHATCGCGAKFTGFMTKAGKVSAYTIGSYRNHLHEAAANPEDEYYIGKVDKNKLTWMVKVIHRAHPIAAVAAETSRHNGYYKNWVSPPGTDSYMQHYGWGILVERYSKKGTKLKAPYKIEGIYRTREEAIVKANHFLTKQAEHGFTVEYATPQTGPVTLPTFGNTLSNMLSLAEEAAAGGDLGDVVTAMEELDRVIGLFDVIKARREELAAIKEQRTIGLLN
jgi:hypothetical protein